MTITMAASIASRTRINPTSPDELVGRWILNRARDGVLYASYIVSASFNFVEGFTVDDLDRTEPVSLRFDAQSADRRHTVVRDFELGGGLLLANTSEVQTWIAVRSVPTRAEREIEWARDSERATASLESRAAERDQWAAHAQIQSEIIAGLVS